MAIFSGLTEHKVVQAFVDGASDLLGVALTIGLARAVSIVMDTSHTSDTIMHFFSQQVSDMSPLIFVWFLFIVYIILGFFHPIIIWFGGFFYANHGTISQCYWD
ncbi:hypothetical protein LHEH8_03250 [Lactobacillus helveticus]|jgi:uncharacterized ion transporter superfamily protein YfcC|uniref:Uncharacterized protein n=1 Tax=Lactobacillus helveticus TaxID=1587 RepID=A0A8H9KHF6_LACHE|nr:mfs superfamily major facilitator transporter [Lactobacillus helveticus]GFO98569.1 hypothetical protein LHEH8_03250 [Lactobacillus helveticus]GFP00509.1 hypothetical protein LHEW6_03420 [Lactobacillus helveticus]GFP03695.1 hypothetical protein LHEY10_16240 [Lactobacillus helveticus]GFP05564.1 hypothetical protein LMG22465_15770 [Lactobacillus helveticus]